MSRKKRGNAEESSTDALIERKVEDMEDQVRRGILDEQDITTSFVHTWVRRPSGSGVPKEEVVQWFLAHRPQYIEQSKQAEIWWYIRDYRMAFHRDPSVDEITRQIEASQHLSPLGITRDEITQVIEAHQQRRGL